MECSGSAQPRLVVCTGSRVVSAVLFSAQTTSSLQAADVVVTGDIVIKRRVSAQPDADRHRSVVGLSAARVCVCLHHLSFIST